MWRPLVPLAAAGPDDTIIFAIIVVGFPLFGAAVFFWWRWQYGVWAPARRARTRPGSGHGDGTTIITINNAAATGAMTGTVHHQPWPSAGDPPVDDRYRTDPDDGRGSAGVDEPSTGPDASSPDAGAGSDSGSDSGSGADGGSSDGGGSD